MGQYFQDLFIFSYFLAKWILIFVDIFIEIDSKYGVISNKVNIYGYECENGSGVAQMMKNLAFHKAYVDTLNVFDR